MDQFQSFILKKTILEINVKNANISISKDALIIEQSENAHIHIYEIKLKVLGVERIQIDGKSVVRDQNEFSFNVDFERPNKLILFKFKDGIANDLSLPIKFISKDKKIWDEKVRLEKWKDLQTNAQISLSTGIDLVNVYFRPCNDDYEKTVIELSTAIGEWSKHPSVMGRGDVFVPSLLSGKVDKLMGNFSVENGIFFKSITGLAFGAYAFRLSQFSKDRSLLFTSEYKYFAIQKKGNT